MMCWALPLICLVDWLAESHGIRLLGHAPGPPDPTFARWMLIITTALGIPSGIARRAYLKRFVARAVPLRGDVVSLGKEAKSLREVTFQYVMEGKTFKRTISVTTQVAEVLQKSGVIELMVDPLKPERFLFDEDRCLSL